ncbi:MAG: tetratricopeptide repeat protein [Myxococcales bacterium]|nr:tetratricopeptide repeat protein [Myxococcales bacterium]
MEPEFVAQAQSLFDAGQFQEAVKACRLGLLGKPTAVEGRVVLARALMALGRHDDVLSELRLALEMNGKHVAALTLRGEVQLLKGQPRPALDSFVQASELAPGDAVVADWIAKAQAALGGGAAGSFRATAMGIGAASTAQSAPAVPVANSPAVPPRRTEGRVTQAPPPPPKRATKPPPMLAPPVPPAPPPPVQASAPTGTVELEPGDIGSAGSLPAVIAPAPATRRDERGDDDIVPPPRLGSVLPRGGFSNPPPLAPGFAPSPPPPKSVPIVSDFGDAPAAPAGGGSANYGSYAPPPPIAVSGQSSAPLSAPAPVGGKKGIKGNKGKSVKANKPRGKAWKPPAWVKWSLGAIGVLVAGIVVGLAVRRVRLDVKLEQADARAEAAAKLDTFRGWQVARDTYELATKAHATSARALSLVTAEATLVAEYGEASDDAETWLEELPADVAKADTALPRALLAIANGEPDEAEALVGEIPEALSAWQAYIRGRVAELRGDWLAATMAYQAADRETRVAFALRHADALAKRELYGEALAVVDRVLAAEPRHPRGLVAQVEISALGGQLGNSAGGLERAEETLARLISGSEKPNPEALSAAERERAEILRTRIWILRGERKQGAAGIATLAASEPVSWENAVRRADLLLFADQAREASDVLKAAATKWPAVPALRIACAKVALSRGDVTAAAEWLGQPTEADARADALLTRARLALATGDLAAAARESEEALVRDPKFISALAFRAEVDLAAGDPGAAQARVMMTFRTSPSTPLGLVYAKSLVQSGEREKAREVLLGLTMARGDSGAAWLALARLERMDGRLDKAKDAYKSAISVSGTIEAKMELATVDADAGNLEATRASLSQLADETGDGRVFAEAARFHTMLGKLGEAGQLLDKATAATGPDWLVARERGRLYFRLRKRGDAIAELSRAVSLAPTDAEAALLLIDALLYGGDIAAARKVATQLGATSALGKLAIGKVDFIDGQSAKASESLAAADAEFAKSMVPPLLRADATFWLAYLAYESGDLTRTVALLEKALAQNPAHVSAIDLLGLLQKERGDNAGARKQFARLVELDPENADAWFALGQVALAAGDRAFAKSCFETSLQKAPSGDNAVRSSEYLQQLRDGL